MHVYYINPFHSGYSKQDPLANSEDPNTIPHKVVFPQGLHCLLRLKQSSGGGGEGVGAGVNQTMRITLHFGPD